MLAKLFYFIANDLILFIYWNSIEPQKKQTQNQLWETDQNHSKNDR